MKRIEEMDRTGREPSSSLELLLGPLLEHGPLRTTSSLNPSDQQPRVLELVSVCLYTYHGS